VRVLFDLTKTFQFLDSHTDRVHTLNQRVRYLTIMSVPPLRSGPNVDKSRIRRFTR
jgi:hypothetical protein